MESLVIVGASLAGLSAARAARTLGYAGRLTVIGAEAHRPYDRPPLSKAFLAGTLTPQDLSLEDADDELDVRWLLGTAASGFDPATRSVLLADGRRERADGLVIATGARARTLPALAGVSNAHTLRTLDDAARLAPQLRPGARVVVIGAGFVGAEVASTARTLGADVTVLERSAVPLVASLGAQLAPVIAGMHERAGVRLLCNAAVAGFEVEPDRADGGSERGSERRVWVSAQDAPERDAAQQPWTQAKPDGGNRHVRAVHLTDGRVLPVDVLLVGIGAVPDTEWLTDSDVAVADGVVCDEHGRTSVPDVVAVGDCATWWNPRAGRYERHEHWQSAVDRAPIALAALLGGAPSARTKVPYFWSDQYEARIQFAGTVADAVSVEFVVGAPEQDEFVAVYHAPYGPVGVLARNSPRGFVRWRKQLDRIAAGEVAAGRVVSPAGV